MKKINIIIFLFLFTFIYNLKGQKLDSLNIKLDLNKLEFNQDDTIKLLIINTSIDTLYLYYPHHCPASLKLKTRTDNGWEQLDIGQVSGGLRSFTTYLPPFDSINFVWYQWNRVYNPTFTRLKVSKGEYRFEIEFWTSYEGKPSKIKPVGQLSTKSKDYYISYSEKFIIK